MTLDDAAAVCEAINRLNHVILRPEARLRFLGPSLTEVSTADFFLLGSLAQLGPIRLSDLAGFHGVDKSTTSLQITRLRRLGLVDRQPDPEDGRAALVRLAPKGRGLLRRNRTSSSRVYAQATQDWSAEDLAELGRLTTRLAESFEELVDTGRPTGSLNGSPTG